ncbi:MAG: T9SS type A sorting domain-containing protein [Bacteroidetes bacterium]|nr:T9SS type A sorting domain-containing protein [Bacteroidota bacterium]
MNKLFTFLATIILTTQFTLHSQTQIGEDIDGEAPGDQSGISISIDDDGSKVAIGAFYNNGNGSSSGHVRIYQNINNNWAQLGQDIDGAAPGDWAGEVALSGDSSIVAIGASFNDGNGANSGHVRVYEYAVNIWAQLGQDINGTQPDEEFGGSVSISDDGSKVSSGSWGLPAGVRVFENINNTWTQLGQYIDGIGTRTKLSSDGSIIAISGEDGGLGLVKVYQFSNNTWTQLGQDIIGVATEGFGFGLSLSNTGFVVAIGIIEADGNGMDSGQVKVYHYSNNSWTQLGQDIDGDTEGDRCGFSVSLSNSGLTLAIGSLVNGVNGDGSGRVRIYQYSNNSWKQRGQDIYGEAPGDWAAEVSLNGDGSIVAIGARRNDGNGIGAGHVRIYDLSDILSVESITNELNIILYPNPTNDYLHIKGATSKLSARVYDVLGKEVLTANVTNHIDVRSLKSGTYFVVLSDGNKTSTSKLIKN